MAEANQYATQKAINQKITAFPPVPAGGADQFLTKQQIQTIGSGYLEVALPLSQVQWPYVPDVHSVREVYTFIADPLIYLVGSKGMTDEYLITVTSLKELIIDQEIVSVDLISFSIENNVSWMSIREEHNQDLYFTIEANRSIISRTGTFIVTQMTSGFQLSFTITQEVGVVEWRYFISVTPTFINFSSLGGNESYSVISYKERYIDAVTTGESIRVEYLVQSTNPLFSFSHDRVSVIENLTQESREGLLVAQQHDSAKTSSIDLYQEQGHYTEEYHFSLAPNSMNFSSSGGTQTLTEFDSYSQFFINGRPQPITEESWSVSVIEGVGLSVDGKNITYSENNGSARNGVVRYRQNNTGDLLTVSCSQDPGLITYEYSFSVSPNSFQFSELGEDKDPLITSIKTKYLNGVSTGEETRMNYSWSASGPASVTSTTITCGENRTTSSRSGSVNYTQEESGKTASISYTQLAGIESFSYQFSGTNLNPSFPLETTSIVSTIVSIKSVYMNGIFVGNSGPSFTIVVVGEGFSAVRIGGNATVTAQQNNTPSARSGVITLTQNESGKTVVINAVQSAGIEDWTYIFEGPMSLAFSSVAGYQDVLYDSYRKQTINGINTGVQQDVGMSLSVIGGGTWVFTNGNRVAVGPNLEDTERSDGVIKAVQGISGLENRITVKQAAARVFYNYEFNVGEFSIIWEWNEYDTRSFEVSSHRQKYINNEIFGPVEEVAWSLSTQSGDMNFFIVSRNSSNGFVNASPRYFNETGRALSMIQYIKQSGSEEVKEVYLDQNRR